MLAERMAVGNVGLPSFSASPTLLVHRSGGASPGTAWEWVDREGRPTGTRHADPNGAAWSTLSPDGTIFVTTFANPDGTSGGLRMIDYGRRDERVLLEPPPSVMLPAFSPSGRRLAFASVETGVRQLYVMDFPGGKPTRIAVSPMLGLMAPPWSLDERTLVGTDNFGRIVALALDALHEPVTLVDRGSQPRLSPDGRWMAYTALVNGTPDVFVQRFPGDSGDRTRVSTQGGTQPQWRHDGRELFYLAPDGALMSFAVRTSPNFEALGSPMVLFRGQFQEGATAFDQAYLPAPDGQRFVVHIPTEGPVPLSAVRHWLAPTRQP